MKMQDKDDKKHPPKKIFFHNSEPESINDKKNSIRHKKSDFSDLPLNLSYFGSAKNKAQQFQQKVLSAGNNTEKIIKSIIEIADDLEWYDMSERIKKLTIKLEGDNGMDSDNKETNDGNYFTIQSIKKVGYLTLQNKVDQDIDSSQTPELDIDIQKEFESIFHNLENHVNSRPEQLIKVALNAVNALESKHFLLTNLLESLKKGDNYYETMKRFKDLGITNLEIPETSNENDKTVKGKGKAIFRLKNAIKKFVLALYQIIVNAIKSIPNFVKLKPRIGVTGWFPSLSFEIEGDSVTIQAFYELLTD